MKARLSLSPVTIAQAGFEQAFAVTARAGFEGIGLRYDQFDGYLQGGGSAATVRDWLRDYGLAVTEVAFLAEWQYHGGVPLVSRRQRDATADEPRSVLMDRLHAFLAHCEMFECANVTAVPALRETGDLSLAAEEFATLCDIAKPYGVRLCLEFMGTAPQLSTLAAASDFVGTAGRSNGGILLDTFLFHQGGSGCDEIETVPLERIFNVQLADACAKPRDQLNMLEDRVFPGEGVADVRAVARTLLDRGYDGWWTVEIFNPDYARQPVETIAARAYASARALFSPDLSGVGR